MHFAAIHNPQDNKDELANALAAAVLNSLRKLGIDKIIERKASK